MRWDWKLVFMVADFVDSARSGGDDLAALEEKLSQQLICER